MAKATKNTAAKAATKPATQAQINKAEDNAAASALSPEELAQIAAQAKANAEAADQRERDAQAEADAQDRADAEARRKEAEKAKSAEPNERQKAAADAFAKALQAKGVVTDEEAVSDGDVTTLTMVQVMIVKDATIKIPQTVFDFEVPVLRRIYAEDGIEETEGSERDVDVAFFDAGEQYDKLLQKYSSFQNAVTETYPQGAYSLARQLGLETTRPSGAVKARALGGNLEMDHSVDSADKLARKTSFIRR